MAITSTENQMAAITPHVGEAVKVANAQGASTLIALPTNIQPQECIELAALGKDAWNLWRKTYPLTRTGNVATNTARFTGTNLMTAAGNLISDFKEFIFGDGADFSLLTFERPTTFAAAKFGDRTNFAGATFNEEVTFKNAVFGIFAHEIFANDMSLSESMYLAHPRAGSTSFEAATFKKRALFSGVFANNDVDFSSANFVQKGDFSFANFRGNAEFVGAKALHLNFQNAKFHNYAGRAADFSNIEVRGLCDFNSAVFSRAPKFFSAKLVQSTSFDWTVMPESHGDRESIQAYRELKRIFAALQANHEEQRFFRLEMGGESALYKPHPIYWLTNKFRLVRAKFSSPSDRKHVTLSFAKADKIT